LFFYLGLCSAVLFFVDRFSFGFKFQKKRMVQSSAFRAQLQQRAVEREQTECTFSPTFHPSNRRLHPPYSAMSPRHRRAFSQDNQQCPTSRSAARAAARREQIRAEILQRREKEIEANCTFTPQINPKSRKLAAHVRQGGFSRPRIVRIPAMIAQQENQESPNCSFKPQTNQVSANMLRAQTYLELDPAERLSAAKFGHSPFHRRRSPTPDSDSDTSSVSSKVSKANFQEFLTRMEERQSAASRHRRALLQEFALPEKPKINKKSKRMIDRLGLDFDQRIETWVKTKEKQAKSLEALHRSECPFRPKINPKSAELVKSAPRDPRSGGVIVSRNFHEHGEEFDFQPKTNRVTSQQWQNLSEYLSTPPSERLFRGAQELEERMKQRREHRRIQLEEQDEWLLAQHAVGSTSKEQVENFLERQRQRERRAQLKLHELRRAHGNRPRFGVARRSIEAFQKTLREQPLAQDKWIQEDAKSKRAKIPEDSYVARFLVVEDEKRKE
jgi:hypothetical protein